MGGWEWKYFQKFKQAKRRNALFLASKNELKWTHGVDDYIGMGTEITIIAQEERVISDFRRLSVIPFATHIATPRSGSDSTISGLWWSKGNSGSKQKLDAPAIRRHKQQ